MRRTGGTKTRIDWTHENVLGDLDFADDTKTNCLSSTANKVELFIDASKTEVFRANSDIKPSY